MSDAKRDHLLSSAAYDQLKRLAQIGLPAIGTLYFALAQIWGLPNAEKVVGTIVALDAFLGIFLGYSTISYNKSQSKYDGAIEIQQTDTTKNYILALKDEPETLDTKSQALFRIDPK